MIIPIKCFTCGNVIADTYTYYIEEVSRIKTKQDILEKVVYFSKDKKIEKTPEAIVMDKLKLEQCCRRHFLTHCELI
jgi:DNA-directed RNA polymerase I, II, and III subunit RPABC5